MVVTTRRRHTMIWWCIFAILATLSRNQVEGAPRVMTTTNAALRPTQRCVATKLSSSTVAQHPCKNDDAITVIGVRVEINLLRQRNRGGERFYKKSFFSTIHNVLLTIKPMGVSSLQLENKRLEVEVVKIDWRLFKS